MLDDLARSDARWSIAVLRYFNPIGAHESGLIGEDPCGTPNNLLPYIAQVAVGRLSRLTVHGGDYPTIDGTGVRDYIHVCDLAAGHTRALEYLGQGHGYHVWNLGTGTGYSVLQVIEAFERVSGRRIPLRCPVAAQAMWPSAGRMFPRQSESWAGRRGWASNA